jgi:hypothetical protein
VISVYALRLHEHESEGADGLDLRRMDSNPANFTSFIKPFVKVAT